MRQFTPEKPEVQAGRHLGMQMGFYIVSSRRGNTIAENAPPDSYRLLTLEKPHPSFRPRRQEGNESLLQRLRTIFRERCATCGGMEGDESWRYPGVKVKLQVGHRNPHRPANLENAIPQCDQCNRADRGKWIYDKRGRVVGVARADPVIISVKRGWLPESDLHRIFELIRDRLGREG